MTTLRKLSDIRVWVLTSHGYARLLGEFSERLKQFWGTEFSVYVSETPIENWSDGVIRFLESIPDEYIILLHEDFYLTQNVDQRLIEELWSMRFGYDRISLLGNHTPIRTARNGKYFVHKPDAEYQFSLEASIQRRRFLLDFLIPGLDPWETERRLAKTAKGNILSSEHPAIWYTDKSRQLKIQ